MMELGTTIKALIEIGYMQFFGWSLAVIVTTSILALWISRSMEGDDD